MSLAYFYRNGEGAWLLFVAKRVFAPRAISYQLTTPHLSRITPIIVLIIPSPYCCTTMQAVTSASPSSDFLSSSEHTVSELCKVSSAELPTLAFRWRSLLKGEQFEQPFYQPEWFAAYARAFENSEDLSLITSTRGGILTGVMPVCFHRTFFNDKIPARTLRSLSGIHSCRFDLIHHHEERQRVATSTWKLLRESSSWSVIELLDVPPDGSAHDLLKLATQDGFPTGTWRTRRMPYLPLPSDPKDPFANCPKETRVYRTRLESKLRKLRNLGEISLRCYVTAHDQILNSFFTMEGGGWKGRAGSSINRTPGGVPFYREVAQAAAQRGYLKIYSLELNCEPLSMHFGLYMDGIYYAPKVAYDERFAAYSPGQLLVKLVIQDLCSQGARGYDFLGPRAPWKMVWAPLTRDHHNCYIFQPTLRGRLLRAVSLGGARIIRHTRHKLRGDPQA